MRALTLDRGVFTVSLDFELAWGSFDSGYDRTWIEYSRKRGESVFEHSREVVTQLLALFERHDIAATWATVGHLFLDRCDALGGVKHADMPRPRHAWFADDWYACDPASSARDAPLWYGRDLVQKIIAARPRHDLGSHSFSHAVFDDEGCTRDVADAELRKCVELGREMGVSMRSFVYPRNRPGHEELLPKHGFRVMRGGSPFWYMGAKPRIVRRIAHGLDDLLAAPPPCGLPHAHATVPGLWVVPGSMFLQSMDGARRFLPATSRVLKAIVGIERAIATRRVFHLLLHPINFYVRSDAMLGVLDRILAHAARRRAAGRLDVRTMAELADLCERRGDASTDSAAAASAE